MKTLRFFGMALLMVLCAVNFAACSDDDEPIVGIVMVLKTHGMKRMMEKI